MGVSLLFSYESLAVVGIFEVLINYWRIRKRFYQCLEYIKREKPKCVFLIDYPGFNLRLAKKIKKLGVPIAYYVSPQVWAWAKSRVYRIASHVDRMVVLFEFEKKFYEKTSLSVFCSGHPMVEHVKSDKSKSNLKEEWNISLFNPIIALLPGSRANEIKKNLPVMLSSAEILHSNRKDSYFLIPCISEEKLKAIESYILMTCPALKGKIKLILKRSYDVLQVADFAIVASGSATLESACMQTPFVIVYRVEWLTWLIGKMLIKVSFLGLVNIVAGRKVVPEFLQYDAEPEKIVQEVLEILENNNRLNTMKSDLMNVKETLGEVGASDRAAKYFVDYLLQIE